MSIRSILPLCIIPLTVWLGIGAAGSPLRLKYGCFEPTVSEPDVPAHLRSVAVPGQERYYLLQFRGPIQSSWKAQTKGLGAHLLDYVPDFAFIARMTPAAAHKVEALDEVSWVGLYHPAYRISPRLNTSAKSTQVNVLMFPGESPATVEADIRRAGGTLVASTAGRGGIHIEATIPGSAIAGIAGRKGVAWVEPRVERKLFNDVARGLMGVPAAWSPGGFFGAGEIVAVCDSGLDTGKLSTISADFAGRVLKTYDLGRKKKWSDPHGHGTHVAGSVLGSGVLSGSDPSLHAYSNSFAGVAPEAQLVFQSVLDNSGGLRGIPNDLNDLFQPAYDDGARVHTNSWGTAILGAYTIDSRNLDMFTWNNPEFLVLCSAGNEGLDRDSNGVIDQNSIGSPATAKNCIAVGASENHRLSGGGQGTYGEYWPSDYPANPINSDKVSDDPNGLVAFSSRGPTNDGRTKPDVVAPGTNIISSRSHASGAGVLWGIYDSDYVYSGGTSMSTPLAAGASLLVREYYRTRRSHMPSAALVKATLINNAIDLYPGQYGTGSFLEIPSTRPNNAEGWGLVDLSWMPESPPTPALEFLDEPQGIGTGESSNYTYTISDSDNATSLSITLTWTDYPASTSASTALVNDLDLSVVLPDGSTERGNGTTDRLNNVEGIDFDSPQSGNYAITIEGYNVPQGPQPFALVVSRDNGPPLPTAEIDAPTDGTVLSGAVAIKGTASGADFQSYALEYGAGVSPTQWLPIVSPQNMPVVDGVLGIWDTGALADGSYTVRLASSGGSGTSTALVTVDVLHTNISLIKNNPDGTSVTLTGKVVTAGPTELSGVMYVEEPSRASGMRVDVGSAPTEAVIGSVVTVTGTLQTSDGERFIADAVVVVTYGAADQAGGSRSQAAPAIPNTVHLKLLPPHPNPLPPGERELMLLSQQGPEPVQVYMVPHQSRG